MTKKYKAKTGQKDFFVPGVGASNASGILETDQKLESAALVEITGEQAPYPHTEATTPVAQNNAVIGVAPQATTTTATVSQPTPSSESEGVN